MKQLFFLLLFFISIPQMVDAQCTTIICTENGYDLPPIGQVGVLIIFAEWECENGINSSKWPAGGLPLDVAIYQDSNRDQPPASDDKIGQYFWDASFGQLRVYTDYYNQVVTVPCNSNRNDVLAEIQAQVNAGNPNFLTTSQGRLPSYFDSTEGETNHGFPKGNNSNDVIDAVAIIWRNNTAVAMGDCSGLAFTDVNNVTIPFIDMNGNPIQQQTRVLGDWRDSKGTRPLFQVEYIIPYTTNKAKPE